MSLQDKINQNVKFTINNKEYELRVLTISDMAFYEDKYGDINNIMKVLNETGKYRDKYSIVYNQLVDKSDFRSIEVETINNDGDTITEKISGPEMFFRSIKTSESNNPINALVKAIILSIPPQDDNDKKKAEGEK